MSLWASHSAKGRGTGTVRPQLTCPLTGTGEMNSPFIPTFWTCLNPPGLFHWHLTSLLFCLNAMMNHIYCFPWSSSWIQSGVSGRRKLLMIPLSSFKGKSAPESDCHYKIHFANLSIAIFILCRDSTPGKAHREKYHFKNLSSMETIGVKQPLAKKRKEIPYLGGIDDMKWNRIEIKIFRIFIVCSLFFINFQKKQPRNISGDPKG